ncbi:MAG: nitronate monooxygenase [Actinomycetota bacterium]|nr:nitronate monooxygenase [Actinomycetota bacterium]MDQ3616507.1 nitronate monooxygenase [Actinomycetota bacterium]
MKLPDIPTRIVLAPMAGGVGTPELVAAVGNAGGLGFLPSGYVPVDLVRHDLDAVRQLSSAPCGINVFVPSGPSQARLQLAVDYAARLRPWADRHGLPIGRPTYSDDDYEAKIELLLETRPAIVSFTFGAPAPDIVQALHQVGVAVLATVTSPVEAAEAEETGADGLVVQGWEAGAHRGGWQNEHDELGLLPLLQLVSMQTDLPMVAAGGIATGAGIAAVLAAGAQAAMLGTAFMRCPEAGTAPIHEAALSGHTRTVVTKAFTGRRARALDNGFVRELGPTAPDAYPEVHYMTSPLRSEAKRRNDAESLHLWAGQAHALATSLPAGELIGELVTDTRAATGRMLASAPGDPSDRHLESEGSP